MEAGNLFRRARIQATLPSPAPGSIAPESTVYVIPLPRNTGAPSRRQTGCRSLHPRTNYEAAPICKARTASIRAFRNDASGSPAGLNSIAMNPLYLISASFR